MYTKNSEKKRFQRSDEVERSGNKKKGHSSHIHLFFGMCLAVICFMLLFAGMSVASATDYYVSVVGDNAATGLSPVHAWATPSYAAQRAQAGDTIYLIDGTWYDEHVVFANSGTEENPISIKAYNMDSPTLYCTSPKTNDAPAITIDQKSYITVEGITVRHYWRHIYVRRSTHIHILKCSVYTEKTPSDPNPKGIDMHDDTHHSSIENCLVDGDAWNSIGLGGYVYGVNGPYWSYEVSSNITIKDCVVLNNHLHALIDLGGIITDIYIINNTLYQGSTVAIYSHQGHPDHIYIKGNSIHDLNTGIYLDTGASDSVIENNIIYNINPSNGHSIHLRRGKTFGDTTFVSTDNIIRNNYCRGDVYYEMIAVAGENYLLDLNDVQSDYGDTEYRVDYGPGTVRNAKGTSYKVASANGASVTVEYTDGRTFSVDGGGEYATYTWNAGLREITILDVFGSISGTVTDAEMGLGIQGATVTGGTWPATNTNFFGEYTIANVPVGTYTVTASADGYEDGSQSNVVVNEGQTTTVNFQLTETATTEPTPPIVYVAIDGSGDYNCDGTDDQVEINEAIDYVATHSDFTTVHLKAGTYIIDGGPYSVILKGDNKIFEGDGHDVTTIKLKDGNNYLPNIYLMYGVDITNYKVQDFKLDGNKANNPQHVEGSSGSYGLYTEGPVDWIVKNVDFYSTTVDMLYFLTNAQHCVVEDCAFFDSGHDAIRITEGSEHVIRNCYADDHGDKAVRLYHTKGCLIEHCDFKAGDDVIGLFTEGAQLLTDTTIRNCIIRNDGPNSNLNGPGIRLLARGSSTITNTEIANNILYQTGGVYWYEGENTYRGGILLDARNSGCLIGNTLIENNVIYDTWVGSGIEVSSWVENTIVENNIITDSAGYGINGANIVSTYNDVYNNALGGYGGGASAGTGDISVDPLFADPASKEFHLKSTEGRWTESGWVTDSVDSLCIDAGDPSDDYSNEPTPNGGRINMGAYGNTAEASMSAPTGPDTTPPYTTGHSPAKDATGVSKDTNIIVHVKDDGEGVDQSSIVMTVEGIQVTPTSTGTANNYTLTYNPPSDFDYDQVLNVTIDVKDLASPPNVMPQDSYSFIIESAPDTTSPAEVTDLATSNPTSRSIPLTWTAPGDDGDEGTATEYDVRYSTSEITEANWDSATQCTGESTPQVAGSAETFTVTGLFPDTTYYFALKAADEVPNWSETSNCAIGTTKEETLLYLWLEAEDANTITPDFEIANDALASNGMYLWVPEGIGWNPKKGEAFYTIHIDSQDDYVIWGKALAANGSDNSFFVQIDDDFEALWAIALSVNWQWDAVNHWGSGEEFNPEIDPVVFTLSAGEHTLRIKQREDGAKLDELLITNDMSYVPALNNPPTAFIDSITPDPAEQGKDTVSFTGHGTDTDGSIVAYHWSSSIDGQLSTTSSFGKPASELSVGSHTIYFKVQDNDGAWSTEITEDLTIIEPANQAPVSDPKGPYTGTEGVPIAYNGSDSYDPDGSIVAYEWDFGDGNNTTGATPTHAYTQNGTYNVTLTVTDNEGATNTSATTATVADTEPVADFSATPTSGPEPLTVAFSDNSTSHDGIETWEWDFDNDSVTDSTEQNPTYVYAEDSVYTVSLTVYESDGDSDTMTKADYITVTKANQPPVSDPNGPYTGTEGVAIAFDGSTSLDPDGSIVAYEWDFGNGTTATGVTPTHTYTQNGTYTVTLTVTDNDGATNTSTTTATIADTEPTADFSAMPTSGLRPLTVAFTDNSASHDGIEAWKWDFNNDGVTDSTEQNPTYVYAEDGVYTVSLEVTESDGDSDTMTKTDYITVTKVNQPPVSDPNGPYTGTEGVPIAYNGSDSYDPDGSIVAYEWDFGDGNNTTGVAPTHTYAQDGIYTVTLTVTDNDGATDTSTTTATIADTEPTADFSATPTSGQEPLTVAFTDNSASYDGIVAWNWNFDTAGVTDSTEQNPTYMYEKEGVYTVSLTIHESDGDSDTKTKVDYITVTALPTLVGEWHFDEGEGTTAVDSSEVENDGTLTNMDPVTAWTDGKLGKALEFDGSNDYVDCGNDPSLWMGTSDFTIEAWLKVNGDTFSGWKGIVDKGWDSDWSFYGLNGNTILGFGIRGIYSSSRAGAHSVTDGQWHHVAVAVDRDDEATFYVDGALDGATFDISSKSNENLGSDRNVRIGYPMCTNGSFNGIIDEVKIYRRALSAGEIREEYEAGSENHPPTAFIDSITPDTAEQGKDTVSISGHGTDTDGSIAAYNWRSDVDGLLSNASSFSKPASEFSVGTHTIYFKVQDDDGAWSTEVTEDLTIVEPANLAPVSDPSGPYTGTEGVAIASDGSTSLDPDGSIVSYEWVFGDGTTATGVAPTHTYAQNGTYNVTLTVTDNDGATNTSTTTATITDTGPTAAFSATPTSGPEPLTVAFTDASTSHDGIEAWSWDFDGDGETDSTEQNPTHVYAEEGIYTVSLTVTESDGDSDTMTKADYISVTKANQPPISDPNGPYTGTEGVPIHFNGSGSYDPDGFIVAYAWDFGDGNTTTGVNPTHTYAQDGIYTVTLTVTDNEGATNTSTTTATIADTEPTVDFSATPTSGLRPLTVKFTDNATSYDGIVAWNWDFDNDGVTDSTTPNPTYVYAEDGVYTVSLTVFESDGDSDTMTKVDYITVTKVNEPPVSDPSGPYTGTEGVAIDYDESGSYDPDGSIVAYAWDFGDGNNTTGVAPTHTYAQDGIYTVTLTVTDNDGATDTSTTTATIADTGPTADFTATPTSGLRPLAVAFTDASTSYDGIEAWNWDFDSDGETDSTEQNPTQVYAEEGVYTVCLTVTESDEDSDTMTKVDYIIVTEVNQNVYLGLEAEDADIITSDFEIVNDISAVGDNLYIQIPEGVGFRANDGEATYTILIDSSGDYLIWGKKIAATKADNSFFVQIDDGTRHLFTTALSDDWQWDAVNHWGSGEEFNPEIDPVVFPLSAGEHTLRIIQREDGAKLDKLLITNDMSYVPALNNPPTAFIDSITPDPAEQGKDTVSFSGHGTDTDGSIVAYHWSSSIDGLLSTASSFSKPASELSVGSHTIYFKVQDDEGAWSTEVMEDLIIIEPANQPPVSDPNGPYTGTEGVPIAYDGSDSYDTDGSIVAYEWAFGDGSTSSEVNPTHTYAQDGIYSVSLTVTDNDGATDTSATTATIADTEPVADFSAMPTSGLSPLTVAFTDASTSHDGIEAWSWDFDSDGETDSTEQNPTHVYAEEGIYTMSLTVTESDGDSDTMTKADYISVTKANQPPISDPNGPYTGTEGVPIAYDGSGTYDPDGSIVAYAWDFGDGNNTTGVAPTHTYAQDGIYTVTLTVTDNDGATNTSTTTATIADTEPTADFSATPTSGLRPLTVAFTDASTSYDGIEAWRWDFDSDGETDSTEQNPTHVYAEEGIYTVCLTVTESDEDSDTMTKADYIIVTEVNQSVYLGLEAEDADIITSDFEIVNDISAVGGNMYIQIPEGVGFRANDGEATYTILIDSSGDYLIWGKKIAATPNDNSFFVQIDDGTSHLFTTALSDDWQWDAVNHWGSGEEFNPEIDPVVFPLSAGEHTLRILQREDGAKLDKLLITNDTSYVPAENEAPNMPAEPSPSDSATDVSIDAVVLCWTGGDPDAEDTVTYNVYFGTSISPPLVVENQPENTYDPGTLDYSTEYYWQIVATDNHGATTEGEVWAFTTTAAPDTPPIVSKPSATPDTILNDNGRPRIPGTNISQLSVTVTDDTEVDAVTIDLSPIGGSYEAQMTNIPGTDTWTITTNAVDGINIDHNLIVTATDTNGNSDSSVSIQLTILRRGDVDHDNDVDQADALAIWEYSKGFAPDPGVFIGDVYPATGNNVVNERDAIYIFKYVRGNTDEP